MITIITGHRGIGKTTCLLKIIKKLRADSVKISGIITPPIYNGKDKKVGFTAYNVETEEMWDLARTDKTLAGPSYGPFSFSKKGLIRANDVLKESLQKKDYTIFLDEVGPLELSKHQGFFPVLPLLTSSKRDLNLYIIIRPELIDIFVNQIILQREHRVLSINLENRDDPDIIDSI